MKLTKGRLLKILDKKKQTMKNTRTKQVLKKIRRIKTKRV